jgi:hypothetical protein
MWYEWLSKELYTHDPNAYLKRVATICYKNRQVAVHAVS